MAIEKVLIVGAGTMGSGLAQTCAQAGIGVYMTDAARSGVPSTAPSRIAQGAGLRRHDSPTPRGIRGLPRWIGSISSVLGKMEEKMYSFPALMWCLINCRAFFPSLWQIAS